MLSLGNYFSITTERNGCGAHSEEFSNYSVYKDIFNREPIVQETAALLPFERVLDEMFKYANSLYAEFIETTENEAFLEVSAKFFELTFWHQHIYVWYNSEEEKFYLLKKIKENDKTDKRFIDLLSEHETTIISIPILDEVIKHTWDGLFNTRFRRWYKLCFDKIMKMNTYHNKCALYTKTLKRNVHNNNTIGLRVEEEALFNGSPILDVKGGGADNKGIVNSLKVLDIVSQQELDIFLSHVYKWFDREIYELGRVANVNAKGARTTVGENYLDTHAIVNRQRLSINQLNIFANKMKKHHGIELKFEVNKVKLDEEEEPEGEHQKGTDPVQADNE